MKETMPEHRIVPSILELIEAEREIDLRGWVREAAIMVTRDRRVYLDGWAELRATANHVEYPVLVIASVHAGKATVKIDVMHATHRWVPRDYEDTAADRYLYVGDVHDGTLVTTLSAPKRA